MKGKLTLKQRKFWKAYIKSHNISESANHAGCKAKSKTSLCEQGRQILKSLELSIPELLNAQGLSDDVMAKPLQDALQAKKYSIGKKEEVEDHLIRLKAAELIGKMKGAFVERHEIEGTVFQVTDYAKGKD